jgi:hypothetical protein
MPPVEPRHEKDLDHVYGGVLGRRFQLVLVLTTGGCRRAWHSRH